MKRRGTTCLLVAVLLLVGCATTREKPTKHIFRFDFDGRTYEIVSTVTLTGEGYNYLVRREDGEIVVSVRDDDQDGVLDWLIVGDESLDRMNAIYRAGMVAAIDGGKYVENLSARIFTAEDEEARYVVGTYLHRGGEPYNKLHVFRDDSELIAVDRAANGHLDSIERGKDELVEAQTVYDWILTEGMAQGRIALVDGRYLVARRHAVPRGRAARLEGEPSM